MSAEAIVKKKQQFLRDEIIDKGYDAGLFVEYITSVKEGGEDIDVWSFDELSDLVKKFQATHDEGECDNNGKYVEDEEVDIEQTTSRLRESTKQFMMDLSGGIESLVKKQETVEEPKEEEEQEQKKDPKQLNMEELIKRSIREQRLNIDFDQKVTCSKLPSNNIGNLPKLKSYIILERMVKGGLFSKSYVSYTIHTTSLGVDVERRYSEFDWLRSVLLRDYPGVYIPPIARKQIQNFETEFLENRYDSLNKFIQTLSQHSILKHSPHYEAFVNLEDQSKFEKARKKIDAEPCIYSSLSKDFSLPVFSAGFKSASLKTKEGEYTAKISKDLHAFTMDTEKYFRACDPVLQKLKSQFVEINNLFEKVSVVYGNISNEMSNLEKLTEGYSSIGGNRTEWQALKDVFGELKEGVNVLRRLV